MFGQDTARRRAELAGTIDGLRRRQANLLEHLEYDDDGDLDPDVRRAYQATIRDRFADLTGQIHRLETQLAALAVPAGPRPQSDPQLIDRLPQLQLRLAEAPEDLQRALYDRRPHHHLQLAAAPSHTSGHHHG